MTTIRRSTSSHHAGPQRSPERPGKRPKTRKSTKAVKRDKPARGPGDPNKKPAKRRAPGAAAAARARGVRPELSGSQRRHLRALAHALSPIVHVGHQGVSEALIDSLDQALADHELLKVKVNPNLEDPLPEVAEALAAGACAAVIQTIGRIVVLYRPHPDEPKIVLES